MTYELAKKLKDAGFPFDEYVEDTGTSFDIRAAEYIDGTPTLSELIQACGDKLYTIQHNISKNVGEWYVIYESKEIGYPVFYSDTPEEAVANLWLELNKK